MSAEEKRILVVETIQIKGMAVRRYPIIILRCFLCKHNSPLIIIYCLFYVTGRKKGRLLYIAHLRRIYFPRTLPLLTNTKRRTFFLSMKKKGPLFNKVCDGQGSLYGATCSYMAHDSKELLCHEVYNETIFAARSV